MYQQNTSGEMPSKAKHTLSIVWGLLLIYGTALTRNPNEGRNRSVERGGKKRAHHTTAVCQNPILSEL